jgi:tetratricopeptide (TPR) repeat protein
VLDNLEEVDAAREGLGRLSGGGVRVLVTARRADWPGDLGLGMLRLEVFTARESRAFLREYLPEERVTDGELDALAERLGHLPLALELAGRYLARMGRVTVGAYLEKLEAIWSHPSMAGWREDLGGPTGHDLDLAATFAVSWERVEEEEARRVFLAAGWCAPNQPIPWEVLEEAAGLDTAGGDAAGGVLAGLGLVEEEEAQAGPSLHPLLAEFAGNLAPEVLPAVAGTLARLARAANDRMDETGSPSHFVPLLPHVRAVAEAAEREILEDAASLWSSLGYHLQRVAEYAGARAAYERALAIDERAYGPEHPEVATDVNNLGSVLRALGDLAGARAAFERALAIDERVHGPEHPNVAIRVNNLGNVLHDLGDLAGARAAFERALAIFERCLPEGHPKIELVRRNLERLGN